MEEIEKQQWERGRFRRARFRFVSFRFNFLLGAVQGVTLGGPSRLQPLLMAASAPKFTEKFVWASRFSPSSFAWPLITVVNLRGKIRAELAWSCLGYWWVAGRVLVGCW